MIAPIDTDEELVDAILVPNKPITGADALAILDSIELPTAAEAMKSTQYQPGSPEKLGIMMVRYMYGLTDGREGTLFFDGDKDNNGNKPRVKPERIKIDLGYPLHERNDIG